MRIAVFSDTFFPQINGVSRVLSYYVDYMNNNSIEYLLFVPEKEQEIRNDNIINFNGVKCFFYPGAKIALPSYSKIKTVLDNFQPDLIHLVTPFSMGLSGLKYAQTHAVPIVASYHTNFDQYLAYYRLAFLAKTANRYLKWFHSFSKVNFCPSRATLMQLQKLGIENLDICPNGVEQENFSPHLRNDKMRELLSGGEVVPILLYVGRLAPEKGLHILMQAIEILNDSRRAFKLVLVGDGPSREKLEKSRIDNRCFLAISQEGTYRKYTLLQIFSYFHLLRKHLAMLSWKQWPPVYRWLHQWQEG